MKVTPIKQYNNPAFPTRTILDEHPELLRMVPKRWRANPMVMATLTAATALALSGQCFAGEFKLAPGQKIVRRSGLQGYIVSRPTIPSEEEARQIINEEAKKAGIFFGPDAVRADVPKSSLSVVIGKSEGYEGVPLKFDALMDGADKKHSIYYEYVSEKDLGRWTGKAEWSWCVDLEAASAALQSALTDAKPKGYYKVFYATSSVPTSYFSNYVVNASGEGDKKATAAYFKHLYEASMDRAREDLRKQVRDFISWLKAQGVI